MTADISRPFARTVQTMLQAALPAGIDIYYGYVDEDNLTFPYVVVWVIPARRIRANLTGTIAAPDARVQLTGVGRDPDEVASVLDRCSAALHGKRPALDGWRPGLIWEMPIEQPVSKNEDLWTPEGTPTYRGVSMFRLSAEPAPEAES